MRARFRTVNGATVGSLSFPTVAGGISVHAVGDDRADALAKAALVAERIVNDPVMRALMPPQAAAAIKAAKGLAAAAKRGTKTLRRVWGMLRGPGKRRLAAVLHKEAERHENGEGQEQPSTGDVGWNPFRKKRKRRKAPPPRSRRMAPPEEEEEEPELPGDGEEQPSEAADVGDDSSDVGDDVDMSDVGDDEDMGDVSDDVNGGES